MRRKSKITIIIYIYKKKPKKQRNEQQEKDSNKKSASAKLTRIFHSAALIKTESEGNYGRTTCVP